MNIFPNEEEIKIIGYYDLNKLITLEDIILTIDYFYDLNGFDQFDTLDTNKIQQEMNKNIEIILVLGSEKGEICSIKLKDISIPTSFLLENIFLLKQKKYFHRIEDVNNFFVSLNYNFRSNPQIKQFYK